MARPSTPSSSYNQRMFALVVALSILQGHLVVSGPAAVPPHQVAKRQAQGNNNGGAFANDLGDFIASVISTGLRSAAAFITSGTEASQRVAVAVGSAAIPPLLNVSRTYNRVQQSSPWNLNGTSSSSPAVIRTEPVNLGTLTRVFTVTDSILSLPLFIDVLSQQVNEGIRPAVQTFGEAFNQTFRAPNRSGGGPLSALLGGARGASSSSSGSAAGDGQQQQQPTRVNPFDTEIPDVIDWDN